MAASVWWAVLCFAAVLAAGAGAAAEGRQRVVVLAPAELDGRGRELLSRLVGELAAADFEVIRLQLTGTREPRDAVVSAPREFEATAGFAIDTRAAALRLWMSDLSSSQLAYQDWQDGDPRLAAVLAVQGVAFVRAGLASASVAQLSARDEGGRATPALAPSPRSAPRFGVQAGVACMLDASSGGASYMPIGRLAIAAPFELAGASFLGSLRLGGGAFGSQVQVRAASGHASVKQSFALVDALVAFRPELVVSPFLSAGVGMYRVATEGSGAAGFFGQSTHTLSALAGAGLGLLVQPFEHVAWIIEGQGLFASEPSAVRIGGERAATLGRPSLLFSTALGVSL